jgi:hypothetical protein
MRRHRFPPRPVSRSLSLAVLAVVTFVLAPGVGFAQEPGEIRVHVLPIENRTDRAQFDAVGGRYRHGLVLIRTRFFVTRPSLP